MAARIASTASLKRQWTAGTLPAVGILRLAENPGHAFKNKVALSFQRHTGIPSLQPDVAMLCWE
jgi:hypothetical protein